jgi:hypothetical protein
MKLAVNEFTRRATETFLVGSIENRDKTPKTYPLTVEFLDKSGNVVDTQTVSVGPVAPKASGTFRVKSDKGGVYGYRYKPLS